MTEGIPDRFPIGTNFYHGHGPNRRLLHVRGFVDDQVVVRWWRASKQYWAYECLDQFWFEFNEKYGEITK